MTRLLVVLATVLALGAAIVGLALLRARTPAAGAQRDPAMPLVVVATTGLVADAVREVGGARVHVTALMGPGVDPHLYKASEGDVARLAGADAVFFSGLHLEGKMGELLEEMGRRGVATVAVTDGLQRARLRTAAEFEGAPDPHVWFDVGLWRDVVRHVGEELARLDPTHAAAHRAGAARYGERLAALDAYVRAELQRVPEERRVLVTAHDAFGYFGAAYGVEVHGIQGVSTAAEAGSADLQALAELIATRRVPALFVESSVPPRIVEALRAAVRARGFEVTLGGELFSDALGTAGTPEGTYEGMVRHNVRTIVSALEGDLATP